MIGYLAHHVIDDEIAVAELLARDQGERLDHEGLFLLGWGDAMIAEHGHRRIAGIAIEDRELEWQFVLRVPGRVVLQFAEIAFRHWQIKPRLRYSEKPR